MGTGFIAVACLSSVLCLTSRSNGFIMGAPSNPQTQYDQNSQSCHAYTDQELDTSQCTSYIRAEDGRHHGNFTDLLLLMTDAANQEHKPDFIAYTTIIMFQYIHCASDGQAIANLFYDVPLDRMPPDTSDWWSRIVHFLHPNGGSSLIGRRRKRTPAQGDGLLLLHQIADIAHTTHPSCVQWLINRFRGASKAVWHQTHHNFPNPNHYTLQPTTPTTTTTTPTTPTTTTTKTTPTTPTTTKTTPTTPTTTPTTTTTKAPLTSPTRLSTTSLSAASSLKTTASTSRPIPVSCVVCSGLECLIKTTAELSQPCDGGVCMVHMVESIHLGRTIERSCGMWDACLKAKGNNAQHCDAVDSQKLGWEDECSFCCGGDDCNEAPLIIPSSGLWNPPRTAADGR